MPITDQYQRLPLSQITVLRDSRQRREIDTTGILDSIRKRGVMSPIIVRSPTSDELLPVLVAGERRYMASVELELPDIPVRFLDELNPIELAIVELEENIKRRDLHWRDLVSATARIHQLYCELDPDWTMTRTAEEIGVGHPTVSAHLRVFKDIGDERVQSASTHREAYNLLVRRDQRAMGNALEELLSIPPAGQMGESAAFDELPEPAAASNGQEIAAVTSTPATAIDPPSVPPVESCILQQSFLDWAPSYTGPKFNLIHCDFPYGVDLFAGKQGRWTEPTAGYADSPAIYQQLLEGFCSNLENFASISCHLLFWCSARYSIVQQTLASFAKLAPTFTFSPFPLIWVKSDSKGIVSDPRQGPRHTYEMCLFATRGHRQIVRVVVDAYSAPGDRVLHPSTKPEPMLRHFMTMLVDEHTSLLDPTCGSGSSLRAAESLGAAAVLGLEIDEGYCNSARQSLRQARQLRIATSRGAAGFGL